MIKTRICYEAECDQCHKISSYSKIAPFPIEEEKENLKEIGWMFIEEKLICTACSKKQLG